MYQTYWCRFKMSKEYETDRSNAVFLFKMLLVLFVLFSLVCLIMKTCLYNFDPLKPHFYKVKLGFTCVYIIFSYFCSKHRGGSNEYPQSMFWAEIWKISDFFIWFFFFFFFCGNIFSIFDWACFRNATFFFFTFLQINELLFKEVQIFHNWL